MVEPDQFSPATRHELTAALDVSRQAISDAHRNMRVLDEERARAEKSIQQLKEELERAQRKGKEAEAAIDALKREASKREEQRRALEEQLGKSSTERKTLEEELARTRAARAQLVEQQDRLQRELAEARAQAESESPELATAEQLGASLQEDAATLQQALEQLEKRLDNAPAGPLLAPAHKGKRVIWIGCKGCPDCSLFADFAMEKLIAADPQQALALLSGAGADGLITDISVTGTGWLSDVRKRWPDLIIVVTTGAAEAHLVVDGSLIEFRKSNVRKTPIYGA